MKFPFAFERKKNLHTMLINHHITDLKAGKASSNISSGKIGNLGSVFKFVKARCKAGRVGC